ncbi:hypothetical protein CW304_28015 [Bacillus sp. UFRGS-B20]|nr:hypothetical protein CW304_28015 [Bacillus sp. UFRGS-B20]
MDEEDYELYYDLLHINPYGECRLDMDKRMAFYKGDSIIICYYFQILNFRFLEIAGSNPGVEAMHMIKKGKSPRGEVCPSNILIHEIVWFNS